MSLSSLWGCSHCLCLAAVCTSGMCSPNPPEQGWIHITLIFHGTCSVNKSIAQHESCTTHMILPDRVFPPSDIHGRQGLSSPTRSISPIQLLAEKTLVTTFLWNVLVGWWVAEALVSGQNLGRCQWRLLCCWLQISQLSGLQQRIQTPWWRKAAPATAVCIPFPANMIWGIFCLLVIGKRCLNANLNRYWFDWQVYEVYTSNCCWGANEVGQGSISRSMICTQHAHRQSFKKANIHKSDAWYREKLLSLRWCSISL